jgi:hypothetical protein
MLAICLIHKMADHKQDLGFLHGGTAISQKSAKQTLIVTSTNHSEIITLYEASREYA